MTRRASKKSLNAALDRLVSIQVREAKGHKCERCGMPANQVHHVISRRYRRLRFDKRNLVSICPQHHFLAHESPVDFIEWFRRVRPDDYDFIRDPENSKPINRSLADLEDLRDELRAA